jgi:ribonuclease P protein component
MRVARAPSIGRLTKRAEFLAAAAGRRFHTERMTLQGRLREPAPDDKNGLRFGFTVTKRVGHATERNRIRRRLRAAAREAGAEHAARRLDVVVIGRRAAISAPYGLLVEDIGRGLRAVAKPKDFPTRPALPMSTAAASRESQNDA